MARRLTSLTMVFVLASCSAFQGEPLEAPVVNLRGLQAEALGINSQVFRARLSLYNPNTVPLRISKGELELELAGVAAATGRTIEPFAVDAGAEKEVEIRITTHLLKDGVALFRALSTTGVAKGLAYDLNGYVNVERRGRDRLPIRSSGTLDLSAAGLPDERRAAQPDSTL